MKAKHIPIFSAYMGFLLAILVLKEELPLWFQGICLIFFITILNHLQWRIYPSNLFLNFLAIALILLSFSLPHTDIFMLFLYVLFILILIKFLSPLKPRDLWQVYTLNLFLFSAATFSNFNLSFGFILILFFWITLIGICFLTAQQVTEPAILQRPLFYFASCLSVTAVLVAVLFFVLLPRSPYTFFLGFGLSYKAKTGFTEDIDLNGIQEIRTDNSVAFRAIMSGPLKSPPYWRGMVYDTYQNGRWRIKLKPQKIKPSCPESNIYHQTIFLEPYTGKTLFALNYPFAINITAPRTFSVPSLPNLTFVLNRPIFQRIEYQASSCPIFPVAHLSAQEKLLYLQMPPNLKGPLDKLLQHLVDKKDPPPVIVKKLVNFLQKPPFESRFQIPKIEGEPVLMFLFKTHKGWCEHFASALTLLLRSAGIPARFVGGYYGGTWNTTGNYYLVRQKDAHAWVEYWNGKNWETIDPILPTLEIKKTTYFSFFWKWLDYLRLRWYAYVINYDFAKQKQLFYRLKHYFSPSKNKNYWQVKKPDFEWSRYKWVFFSAVCLGWMGFLIYFLFKQHKSHPFLCLCELLRNYGYSISPNQGGLEIVDMINKKDPELSYMVRRFVEIWYPMRYGRLIKDKTKTRHLKELLKQIRIHLIKQKSIKKPYS